LIVALVVVGVRTISGSSAPAPVAEAARPNIVVILTDDQRWDELEHMPNVKALLTDQGVTFDQAFVSNPLCCPARATILTGRYSHLTGVWTNVKGTGGWWAFKDDQPFALPTWLHDAGYHTGLIGKYLNGYHGLSIPPGWDRWAAFSGDPGYFDYSLNVDGVVEPHAAAAPDYSTDVLGRDAVDFVRSAPTSSPFFLYYAPYGPHTPYTAAPRDASAHLDVGALPANVNERDVSDKPAYIRSMPIQPITTWNRVKRKQERALLSVDRQVAAIVDAVRARGQLSDTAFLFMSDNGLSVGSHRWTVKQVPYEESIKVPMIWRYDGAGYTPGSVDDHLVVDTDVAPTIADIAGVQPRRSVEGNSLLPFLRLQSVPWRTGFPLEHVIQPAINDGLSPPTYCGVRTTDFMFTRYATGEEELYDLRTDPLEMRNVATVPAYAPALIQLQARTRALCDPTPPGFSWSTPTKG
jgi:arylsulfatase A-like enzyme